MLTVTKIKNLKPKLKPVTHKDSGGLFLMVMSNVSKLWRFRYSWNSKQQLLSLGKYPDISLIEARAKRDEYKKLLAKDINPSLTKQQDKHNVYTLERLLRQWGNYHYSDKSQSTADKTLRRFEVYLFP